MWIFEFALWKYVAYCRNNLIITEKFLKIFCWFWVSFKIENLRAYDYFAVFDSAFMLIF